MEAAAFAAGDEFIEGFIGGVEGGLPCGAYGGSGVACAGGFDGEIFEDAGLGVFIAPEGEGVADHSFDKIEILVIGGFMLLDATVMHGFEGFGFGVIECHTFDEVLAGGTGSFEVGGDSSLAFGGLGSGGTLGVEAVGADHYD